MTTKVAIKGSKDFPQLVIKMLEQAGGKNPYNHIGNDVTGYYYNNFHNEIVCNHPNDVPDEYEKYSFENSIRPILFSTEMVKAIIDGRKTQTRRVIKPQPIESLTFWGDYYIKGKGNYKLSLGAAIEGIDLNGFCKYGNPGDILWVRETYRQGVDGLINYKSDESIVDQLVLAWKPSIHMPKDVCRLFLKIKSVHVERLQDISERDAIIEGSIPKGASIIGTKDGAIGLFRELWLSINGPESWDANPWVWVIEFEVI